MYLGDLPLGNITPGRRAKIRDLGCGLNVEEKLVPGLLRLVRGQPSIFERLFYPREVSD